MWAHRSPPPDRDVRPAWLPAGAAVSPPDDSAEREADAAADDVLRGSPPQAAIGSDLSGVHIHRDAPAAAVTRAMGATALTYGNHIALSPEAAAPGTLAGRRLLAHELAHVVQQGGAGPAPAPGTAPVRRRGGRIVQRQPADAKVSSELDRELAAWAKKNRKSVDPKDPSYAFNLQEFIWTSIAVPASDEPVPKPAKAAARDQWQRNFTKARLVAEKILGAGPAVEQKEIRAAMILRMMAKAGFAEGAIDLAHRMEDDSSKEAVFAAVLERPGSAPPTILRTVSEHYWRIRGPQNNPIIDGFTDATGTFEKPFSTEQLFGLFEPLVAALEKDQLLVDMLTEVLVHKPSFRKPFSDRMWATGKEELLFRVLETPYFVEPGYGPTVYQDFGPLLMERDMPWVYANKQRYLVQYVQRLGRDTGVAIAAPANLEFAALRAWLDAETENIAKALAKKSPKDADAWITMYHRLADAFFFHVEGRDIHPDLGGKLAKLGPAAPQKMRLEADCDVLATYAMRFFTAVRDPADKTFVGFEPIGYMAISPDGGEGHATALMRRDGKYYVISNKNVTASEVVESGKDAPGSRKEDALRAMRAIALHVYEPTPTRYQLFYADAPATGAMPAALARTEPSTRRKDLEP
jgi:hypothetical protein